MSDAANLRALREEVGISQADLADLAGVAVSTAKRWERGVYAVPADVFDALASLRRWVEAQAAAHVAQASALAEELGPGLGRVRLTYYRTPDELAERGGEDCPPCYGAVNEATRRAACALRVMGYRVEYDYPDEGMGPMLG